MHQPTATTQSITIAKLKAFVSKLNPNASGGDHGERVEKLMSTPKLEGSFPLLSFFRYAKVHRKSTCAGAAGRGEETETFRGNVIDSLVIWKDFHSVYGKIEEPRTQSAHSTSRN